MAGSSCAARVADANRRLFATAELRAVNLMSSPGAGKTALLRRTITDLGSGVRVGILEGDIETGLDAARLEGLGAAVSLVNTGDGFGGECHLDATMVRSGLGRLPLDDLDLLLIENVGNLVCPAEFDVGEHAKAMVYAVTEGEEKPLKYPVMFRAAEVVLVNKIDLLPHLDFNLDLFLSNLRDVNPGATIIRVSARTGEGVADWCDWLRDFRIKDRPGAVPHRDGEGGGNVPATYDVAVDVMDMTDDHRLWARDADTRPASKRPSADTSLSATRTPTHGSREA